MQPELAREKAKSTASSTALFEGERNIQRYIGQSEVFACQIFFPQEVMLLSKDVVHDCSLLCWGLLHPQPRVALHDAAQS
jgi:hypothetical protein